MSVALPKPLTLDEFMTWEERQELRWEFGTDRMTDQIRDHFARSMAWASGSADPRLHAAFRSIRREAFLPPGPWRIYLHNEYRDSPDADPAFLYQNILVALDEAKGINNGEPFLHAAWIGATAPEPDDVVCQIGTGTGYYTAILAKLAARVEAFEIDANLAARATEYLRPHRNVRLTLGDATALSLPPSDIIYVNAGVAVPPQQWLQALKPKGRMIFPWRPVAHVGLAINLSSCAQGFAVKPLMPAWFIPCVGASATDACTRHPTHHEAWSTRSAWLTSERPPDDSATAVYPHVWFSSAEP